MRVKNLEYSRPSIIVIIIIIVVTFRGEGEKAPCAPNQPTSVERESFRDETLQRRQDTSFTQVNSPSALGLVLLPSFLQHSLT